MFMLIYLLHHPGQQRPVERVLRHAARAANRPIARQPYQEPASRHDLGLMDKQCRSCNALHWMAEKTAKSSATSPEFGACCNHGEVQIPLLEQPPPPLLQLYTGNDEQAKNFKEYIWQYNRALAFTSLGVQQDHSVNAGNGPPVFRIHGELCHLSGSLLPSPGHAPTYAQLYIYEPRDALQHRMANNVDNNTHLREDTMAILQDVISTYHQYAPLYLYAHEILRNYGETEDVSIRLRVVPGTDRRRYNLPTADEVAVILPGDQSRTQSRDIILRERGGGLQRISDLHPAYAPLYYVLLFPFGENGWHQDLQSHRHGQQPKRISQTRHAAFRLHDRPNEFSCVLRGGRLLQRYIVDMFASADQNRLAFLRRNQGLLRAACYSGMEDAVNAADDVVDLNELGHRVILPSSYTGGPRHMQQQFQDSMAIARYYRKVDLFITMTTNPNWPEITQELRPGETAYDRPDLVARAFREKKEALLRDLMDGVLGKVAAYVYTIEFQKRGLPHVHILVFFDGSDKLLTPEDIDSLISAQWPDPQTEPLLFETVKSCMIHGPCGAANPRARCMEGGRCTKRYPKAFQERTNMDVNGYPEYRRPDDGRAYQVGQLMIDNRWIVPYCPYLSAKYNCHINVECAVSLGSFKYVFKYIQKGGDRATMELQQRDEIKRWINGRYISASEAAWRIFHFETHDRLPNIVRLQIHLPGQHMVVFDPNEPVEVVLARAAQERTSLTAFFEANCDNGPLGEEARKHTYQEFPQYFVWKNGKNEKYWALRKKGFALGRMYFIPPTGGERFYLRTLLAVVKGPRSFDDLRTYNGSIYGTFQEACLARGLLEDDSEWRQCLEEAAQMQTGSHLRQLFSTLLLFCDPSSPGTLWNEFKHYICDDLQHRLQVMGREHPSADDIYDYGLFLLNKILEESGRALADFPTMPWPQLDWEALQAYNPLIAECLDYNRIEEKAMADQCVASLNTEQSEAYTKILESIEREQGKIFFLSGPGGTGKTFVYNTICHKVRSEAWVIIVVASSGIAALLIIGGRTAHSVFKIPIDGLNAESFCTIPKESHRAGLLRIARAIIWDEIGMQHRYAPEALDRTCRDIRGVDKPFGGLTVIFGGDFQQVLPVVPKGTREEVVDATLQRSHLWHQIEILHLHQNMRLSQTVQDQEFAQWLLDVGHGRNIDDESNVNIPEDMICDTPTDLIDFIYPNVHCRPTPPPDYFSQRMILAPRNADVSNINMEVLRRMAGDEYTFHSADKVVHEQGADGDEDEQPIPVEFLRSIESSSLPPGELNLKLGCPLILLRNLAPSRGLCNGTRMILQRMSDRVLEVRLVGGDHDSEIALIPRITLTPPSTADFAFKFNRRQFPVRLAFCLTINKAQGQSVKYVGLDLRVPVFSHGQLYVALSRATSRHRVKVLLSASIPGNFTKNIVYPEVLID